MPTIGASIRAFFGRGIIGKILYGKRIILNRASRAFAGFGPPTS
jgi:hypothetical protein